MSAGGTLRARWSAEDVAKLEDMLARQIDMKEIASQLGRTEHALESKIERLRTAKVKPSDGVGKRRHRRLNGASFFLS